MNSIVLFIGGLLSGIFIGFLWAGSQAVNVEINLVPLDQQIDIYQRNNRGDLLSHTKINHDNNPQYYYIYINEPNVDHPIKEVPLQGTTKYKFKNGIPLGKEAGSQ